MMSFMDYKGKCQYVYKKGLYQFTKNDNKIIETKEYIEIEDPTVDNTFKKIFLGDKSITISLLNSLLFPGKERIKDINFLPTENPGDGPYSRRSIRMDILCHCFLKKKKNVKHFNNDEELIVDLEIEKGFKNSNDQRFLNYAKILVGKYAEIKIMVLALVITPKIIYSYINKGSEILFQKEPYNNYKNVSFYDDISIYQIDLNFLLKLIRDDKDIDILRDEYLLEAGKEWVKFLTVSSWCDSFSDGYFILPPLIEDSFKGKQIFSAIKLSMSKKVPYMKSRIDQNIILKDIIENEKLKEEKDQLIDERDQLKEERDELKEERDEWKAKYEQLLKEKSAPMDLTDEDEKPKKCKVKNTKDKRKRSCPKKKKVGK